MHILLYNLSRKQENVFSVYLICGGVSLNIELNRFILTPLFYFLGGDSMKEKIIEKLEGNIERILNKEELSATDVAILKEKLGEIKREEDEENKEEKKKEMMSMLEKVM